MSFNFDRWKTALIASTLVNLGARDLLEASGLIDPIALEEGLADLIREIESDLEAKHCLLDH